MPVPIEFTGALDTELEEVISALLAFSAPVARRFADAFDRCIEQLQRFPESGTNEAEDRYTIPIGRSGYRILYRFANGRIVVTGLKNMRRLN